MASPRLTRSDMLRLFDLLNAELAAEDVQGELSTPTSISTT